MGEPIEELRRWADAGGHWTVLGRSTAGVTVGLFTCDGGEQMGEVVVGEDDLEQLEQREDGQG